MLISIIPKTTTASAGMTIAKITARRTFIVNAMTIAPNTTNGERIKSLKKRFMPV